MEFLRVLGTFVLASILVTWACAKIFGWNESEAVAFWWNMGCLLGVGAVIAAVAALMRR